MDKLPLNYVKTGVNDYIKHGNMEKNVLIGVKQAYLSRLMNKKQIQADAYSQVVRGYLVRLVSRMVVHGYLGMRLSAQIDQHTQNRNSLASHKFSLLKLVYRAYLRKLLYKIVVRCYTTRLNWSKLYTTLVVSNTTASTIEIGDYCTVDRVPLHQFSREYFTKFNLFVFVLGGTEYVEMVEEMCWPIRYVILVSGQIASFNKCGCSSLLDANENLVEVVKRGGNRATRHRFSRMPKDDQIDYLIRNRKWINRNVDDEIGRILNDSGTYDAYVFK
ncbi:hypothetical protein ECANGB1_398 [Enterospora canceri]|uniref:Uncharacterized protein n=1 Tax=Enterospora canceri TaxID=1081671 RepID=A0A1Y1S876_9MICR|nr:hypothetical protein ECANGB1_398 [Enterospora canceri]